MLAPKAYESSRQCQQEDQRSGLGNVQSGWYGFAAKVFNPQREIGAINQAIVVSIGGGNK